MAGRVLPSRRPSEQRAAVLGGARRVGQRAAQRRRRRRSCWRTANSSSPTCLPLGARGADGGGDRHPLQRLGQVAAGDPAPARRRRRPGRAPARRAPCRTRRWASPARASPSTELSVRARRSATSRRTTAATPNSWSPRVARLLEGAGPGGLLAQLGQRLGRGSAQHQVGAPFRAVLLVSSDSRSARNRSTTRPLRSSSSRDSPTIRPASEVARVPTSARSEVSAC